VAGVSDWVVREYFEALGFLVSQPRKYAVPGRQKKAEEEVDIVVINPTVEESTIPESFVWTTQDVQQLSRAVVGVRGWHTDRFYASTQEQAADTVRFAQSESVKFAARMLGSKPIAKVLCLPRLAASNELAAKTIQFLKEHGIDGVIPFRTMLLELILRVDTNRNYEKSDLLQVIRLLKNYDLLKDAQMELFGRRRRAAPKGPG
jgi:hypothetical protein